MKGQLHLIVLIGISGCAGDWSIREPAGSIPDEPVRGELYGKPFVLASAEISSVTTRLASAGTPWPDREVTIWVGRDRLENELVITPDSKDRVPQIWTSFVEPGDKTPRRMNYSNGYSLRITPISRTGSEIRAKIHLSLPDHQHSFLIGTFPAKTKIPRLLNSGYELRLMRGTSVWGSEGPGQLRAGTVKHDLGPYTATLTLAALSEDQYELNFVLIETANPGVELLRHTAQSTAPEPLVFEASNGDLSMHGTVYLGEVTRE